LPGSSRGTVQSALFISVVLSVNLPLSTAATRPIPLPSYGEAVMRTLIALVVVVALLLIAAKVLPRWLRDRRAKPSGGPIEVVAAHPIEHRRTIYLVRVRGREYLVGSSEAGLHALSGGPVDGPGPTFAQVLASEKASAATVNDGRQA